MPLNLLTFHHHPDQIALRDPHHTWSFAVLAQQIKTRAEIWQKRGVERGIRIAFIASTDIPCILDLFALWHLKAIACPLSPRLPPLGREAVLKRLAPVLFWDGSTLFPFSSPDESSKEAIATLLCTSGTTSTPKIAAHTLENYLANATSAVEALKLGPSSSWHLSLPLYHVSGLGILFRCMVSGAAIVLSQDPPATHYSLVPTQLFRILQNPSLLAHYRKAHCLLVGGAPMTPTLHAEAIANGLPIYTTWGMTETTAIATLGSPSSYLHAGVCLPNTEIDFTEEGEIKVRGATLFQGYLEQGIVISQRDARGWFHTKDLGAFDQQGHLHWQGRKDLLFISGGENIQPAEIEKALGQLPGVVDAIVVPVADQEFGALPAAFIHTASSSFDPEYFRKELELLFPRFKIPRWFFPFPTLAKETMKADRRALSEIAKKNCIYTS